MLSLFLLVGVATAFTPGAVPAISSRAVSSTDVVMGAKKGLFGREPASPTKPKVTAKAKPLSPGSNYPGTKNIQIQSNGFGTFMSKFTFASSEKKSQYGMPTFLPNGNINPAFLAAERKAALAAKKKNMAATEIKRKNLIAKNKFELADYIKKKIGEVGSGKDFYQSGR